ncbi:MAG TPA: hypothetical protein VFZ65_16835 [Planctomycetota bacterium]|nr:hypothetical protein [Planctomycetota bacterium]
MPVPRCLTFLVLLLATAPLPAQWTLRAASPPGDCIGAVFDEARSVTVAVFVTASPFAVQTWEWSGASWSQNALAGNPGFAGDEGAVLVYDPGHHRVLAVIAEGPGSNGGWIQAYEGQTWSAIAPALPRPPAAVGIAAAFDRARGVVVAQVLDETWEWSGAWSQRAVASAPGRIDGCRMTYDPLQQRTLLVGGETTVYVPGWGYQLNDTTWLWDGSQWSAGPTSIDQARVHHALAFDATRGAARLFGGANSSGGGPLLLWYTDSLTLGPSGWGGPSYVPTTNPIGMLGAHLATDIARGRAVLVGNETWEYVRAGAPAFARFGAGCSGGTGVPQLDLDGGSMPWLGATAGLRLSSLGTSPFAALFLGASASLWNGTALPLALPGPQGCEVLVSADVGQITVPSGGAATFAFAVPNATNLIGLQVYAQGLVPDPAPPLGFVLSNGVALRIGVP